MASRQVEWARRRRAYLIAALGGKCAVCGSTTSLTFDCIRPRGDAHHQLSSVARLAFYWREMQKGNVQLLCAEHNWKKGAKAQPKYVTALEIQP